MSMPLTKMKPAPWTLITTILLALIFVLRNTSRCSHWFVLTLAMFVLAVSLSLLGSTQRRLSIFKQHNYILFVILWVYTSYFCLTGCHSHIGDNDFVLQRWHKIHCNLNVQLFLGSKQRICLSYRQMVSFVNGLAKVYLVLCLNVP